MRVPRFLILGLVAAFVVAGCGGGGSGLGGSDVAVVGSIHVKRSQLDQLMDQAKRRYEKDRRPFPKAGSKEFASLRSTAVGVLVQNAERELRAKEMGITVSGSQVDQRLKQIKTQYFQGSDKVFEKQLHDQGITEDQVRQVVKSQLISEGVVNKVTTGLKVSDTEVHEYYITHAPQFATPQSREVRHIRVAVDSKGIGVAKAKAGGESKVDYAKSKQLADKLYAELKGGASFVALAKHYSQDTATKDQGGKLTVSRGQTVAEFVNAAFALKNGEISKPVKTVYGWHIIQALGPIRPASTTPEKQVRDSIRSQLLQDKRNQALDEWSKETEKRYRSKVSYAAGYKPSQAASTTTTSG